MGNQGWKEAVCLGKAVFRGLLHPLAVMIWVSRDPSGKPSPSLITAVPVPQTVLQVLITYQRSSVTVG